MNFNTAFINGKSIMEKNCCLIFIHGQNENLKIYAFITL